VRETPPIAHRGSPDEPFVGIPDSSLAPGIEVDQLDKLVGQTFESAWFQIDATAHRHFVESTFLDRVYGTPFTSFTMVEGFYLLALLDPLVAGLVRIRDAQESALNYGTNRVRFIRPVHESDTLQLKCRIASVIKKSSGTLAEWDCTIQRVENQETVMVGSWLVLYPASEAAAVEHAT
jgi:acyl dehydratase